MTDAKPASVSAVLNVPNQLTIARIIVAIVLFVFLGQQFYITSLLLFLFAAGTDFADGYWARKYGQVTQLGRILDPFADKIIVCGTFVYLVAVPQSLVAAWMVVLIIGREMLVTALRSFVEEQGGDFSAKWSGKWKMVLQCAALACLIFRLSYLDVTQGAFDPAPPVWFDRTTLVLLWAAVVLTAYSGAEYVVGALRLLRTQPPR